MSQQDITAIIYDKRGRVLSIGKNSYVKTHPYQARLAKNAGTPEKVYLHAEIAALVRCKRIESAYRIDVVRVLKDGTLGLAKPCKICAEALRNSGIKKINHS